MRFTPKSSASGRSCRAASNSQPFYDQSEIVNESIKSVRDAILIGLVLASLIMVLFLRDWGTSLVAGLVIPATIAITFIALRAIGQSFNLMTLGGLAAAVGLVIDDAIVVVENIVMHRDAGQSRSDAIRNALRESACSSHRFHHHADRRLPSPDLDYRRHRHVLPRAGRYGRRCLADISGPRAHLDANTEPLPDPQQKAESAALNTRACRPRLMRLYERVLRATLEHPLLVLAVLRWS